ncbi:MAG: radical SAM protein [Candidatus Nanoarchaeia archaeon]|nr:radical SAM protein [Candidatus Nanoarchaeia archaeon]
MEKPRVLLINPPLEGHINAGLDNLKVPLGLAYLAAYLEKKGYNDVKILDALAEEKITKVKQNIWHSGMSFESIEQYIKEYKPQIVGITCSFSIYYKIALEVAKIVKKIDKKIIVVFGGAHVSAAPESVLKSGYVDLVVKGEGELTFFEIVDRYYNHKDLTNIDGTVLIKNRQLKKNKDRELLKNLDEIPFPARHLLNMKQYFNHPLNSIGTMRKPATDIVSSRGCTCKCVFCSVYTIWGRTWRGRSAKNVVDEIEFLIKNYGIKQIRFQDDNVSWDKKRMIEICDEILSRKLNIKWDTPNGIAIWTLDEELLRKMKKSGYYRLAPSIESGSMDTIRFIQKPISFEFVKKILKLADKVGLWTVSPFIIGFPYETKEDILKTIKFASKSGLDFAIFYIAQPYAGTPLYDIYEKEGLLNNGIQESSSVQATKYNSKNFSASELINFRLLAYKEFYKSRFIYYLNPVHIYYFFKKCGNIEGFLHIVKMFRSIVRLNYTKK